MGLADNLSFRDMYHFKRNVLTKNTSPSVEVDPDINSTIKENPQKANVEIEGGELVLKPNMSALFRAVGKKHKNGGMEVFLEDDSFVFSDDPLMAFDKEDIEIMELKKGGRFRRNNTPASIVKKNVDPKHYNRLVANINDLDKDDIAKNSSVRMLEKYFDTLGNIAYIQEEKKNFPDGIPSISAGTAPVYKDDLKEEIMTQKQYLRGGGSVLPKAQKGKYKPKDMFYAPGSKSIMTYEDLVNDDGVTDWGLEQMLKAKQIVPYSEAQGMYSGVPPIQQMSYSGVPPIDPANIPATRPVRGRYTKDGFKGARTRVTTFPAEQTTIEPDINPNSVLGKVAEKLFNWKFTPWQRVSQNYNAWKAAFLKRYMPYRSQLDPSYADPNLVNPEQTVNDMRAATSSQMAGINTMSPILRNAQASQFQGQLLNSIPGVRTQFDNVNSQTKNQFAQYNNQNNTRGLNMQNDQRYYGQSVVGQQNYDNMRTFLTDNWMNNVMKDVQDNQALSYNMATVNNPAWDFDWDKTSFRRLPKDIRDVQNPLSADSFNAMISQIEKMQKMGLPETIISAVVRGTYFKNAAPYFNQLPLPTDEMKKGGMFRPKK